MFYFRVVLLLLAVVSLPGVAQLTEEDLANIKKSRELMKQALEAGDPDWMLRIEQDKKLTEQKGAITEQLDAAEAAANEAGRIVDQVFAHQNAAYKQANTGVIASGEVEYFISFAMPAKDLKGVLEAASSTGGIVNVRGLKRGHRNVGQTMRYMQSLIQQFKFDTPPLVQINPVKFVQYDVARVPTTVLQGKQIYVKAEGLVSKKYLQERLEAETENRYLGELGPSFPIDEVSLLDEIANRIAKVDWEAKSRDAVNRYWKRDHSIRLPMAKETQVYFTDPTVTVTKDAYAVDGTLMARAGEHFNPLQMINMPMALIIFNPSDPRQAEYAKQQQRALIGKMRVQLIASQFDSNMTWQKYGQMMQSFEARVFKLSRELVDKFEIRHVPTVITTENGLFRYHVVSESDLPEDEAAVVLTATE